MVSRTTTIANRVGLHARPASQFVIEAKKHKCACKIRIIPEEGEPRPWANAKSIMMILGAGINNGHRVEVMCDGDGEEAALEALITLIDSKFGEA